MTLATQADTNRAALRWGAEDGDWGLIKTDSGYAAPTMTELRYVSESLKYDKQVIRSNEIRSDRMVQDHIEVGANVSGDVNFELSFGTFDTWFKHLLLPDYSNTNDGVIPNSSTVAGITYTPAGSKLAIPTTSTITDLDSAFRTQGFIAGMWIKLSGWAVSGNNGIFKITTAAADTLTVTPATLSASGGDEIVGPSRTIKGRCLRNGTYTLNGTVTAPPSMLIEKQFTDLTNVYQYFTGMRLAQLALNVSSQQIITGTWGFMGKRAVMDTSTVAAASAANTNTIMNATANVGTLTEGGSTLATAIKSISLTIKNNLRNNDVIGSKFPMNHGFGYFEVEGKLEAYFEDATLYNKLINHTGSSLSFRTTDVSGNALVFTIPNLKFLKGDPLVTGANANVMLPLDFAALIDTTTDCMFQVDLLG